MAKTKANAGTMRKPAQSPVRVISVTSGKGGVGKTNIVTNLAIVLAKAGKKVLLWDADLGLANVDVILGLQTEFNIHHLLTGEKSLREILVEGPEGLRIMPASSGTQELSNLAEGQKVRLLAELDEFDDDLDFLLIDTAAGIGSNVMYFNMAAQDLIVVVTPEPTSITDAYAIIKVMSTRYNIKRFNILSNQAANIQEAKKVFTLLASVADQHLDSISLNFLGHIPKDDAVIQAIRRQQPVVKAFPNSEITRHFMELAKRVIRMPSPEQPGGNINFFWKRLLRI